MKSTGLALFLSLWICLPVSGQETTDIFSLSNYLVNYGGCTVRESLEFRSAGNNLYLDSQNNLYFLSFDRSDETGNRKSPVFIKRFANDCNGELTDSDSIYDLKQTIDLNTFKSLGNGYYKDFSNKYYFKSMADGGEFRVV